MGKQFHELEDKFRAFNDSPDELLSEGTSTYFKFDQAGQKINVMFVGLENRNLDKNNPDRMTECAVVKDINGNQLLLAQTIIVNELKKKWDEKGETGFLARIIYDGYKKPGTPDQYQSFRLFFE